MPEQVVEAGLDAPGAERVKDDLGRIRRFVRVKFMKEAISRMFRIYQVLQFFAQPLYLSIVQYSQARQISVIPEKSHLIIAQAIAVAVFGVRHSEEEGRDRMVVNREIFWVHYFLAFNFKNRS
jgi:hypothetical protein